MSSFLSIDIDFWSEPRIEPDLNTFLEQLTLLAAEKHTPLTAVENHHQMLEIVNNSMAKKLINIDAHSDLAATDIDFISCGTWISYVTWRQAGEYHWICPPYMWTEGDCNGNPSIFCSTYINKNLSDWQILRRSKRIRLPAIEQLLDDCERACVCMSPAFSYDQHQQIFNNWLSKYSIPYVSGVKNEADLRIPSKVYIHN